MTLHDILVNRFTTLVLANIRNLEEIPEQYRVDVKNNVEAKKLEITK